MSQPPQPPDAHGPQDAGEPQYPPPSAWGPQGQYSQAPYPQGQYPQGQYPQGGYPAAGYPPAPAAPPGLRLGDRLGVRALRRPEPRFGISLAAAGAALVLAGVFVWSFGYLIAGLDLNFDLQGDGRLSTHGDGRRFLGAGLFLVLVAAGYGLAVVRRRGPLATAGIVVGAAGIPMLLLFLSFDIGDLVTGGLPFSIDAVYVVSILAWLVSYFAVPGARGRSFLLGAAAVSLASYIALKAAGNSVLGTVSGVVGSGGLSGSGSGTGAVAAIGLIFGLAYYAIAAALDRGGRRGAAVAMVYAAFVTTIGGIIGAVPNFEQVGTGVLLVVLGVGLCWYGSWSGRRFTTWVWAAAAVLGVGLLVQKASGDSYTGAGVGLIVIGAVLALVAHLVSTATGESPDIAEDASAQGPARVG